MDQVVALILGQPAVRIQENRKLCPAAGLHLTSVKLRWRIG